MANIKLKYRYRDYANYKNNGEAIFANPQQFSLEQIDATIRIRLLDGEYFYASQWGLPDLHFEKYDDENDHPFHEYLGIEITDEAVTEEITLTEFLERVIHNAANW